MVHRNALLIIQRAVNSNIIPNNKMKKENKKQEIEFKSLTSNKRVDEIVADFPKSIVCCPRGSFEHQLREHLLKHKVQ